MNSSPETLRTLILGYMWNQPLQQINHLFEPQLGAPLAKPVSDALRKLAPEEKAALKAELTNVLASEITRLFQAVDEKGRRGEMLDLGSGDFATHLPPWEDHLSYFDSKGNPKIAA